VCFVGGSDRQALSLVLELFGERDKITLKFYHTGRVLTVTSQVKQITKRRLEQSKSHELKPNGGFSNVDSVAVIVYICPNGWISANRNIPHLYRKSKSIGQCLRTGLPSFSIKATPEPSRPKTEHRCIRPGSSLPNQGILLYSEERVTCIR